MCSTFGACGSLIPSMIFYDHGSLEIWLVPTLGSPEVGRRQIISQDYGMLTLSYAQFERASKGYTHHTLAKYMR